MKRKAFFYAVALLAIMVGSNKTYAQKISMWQIHEGNEGIINHVGSFNGDPKAYEKMAIPTKNDKGWKEAPKDANGNVYLERSSTLKCLQQVDFTYFQTIVDIPDNMVISDFKVSYDKADDGARIYFFNSKFPNGTFDPSADLIIANGRNNVGSVNLKDKISPGENRVVIVQFDDCADKNSVHNIKISVNGKEIKPTTVATSSVNSGLNIAKGKPCKASSVAFGGVASRAVDGNTNGQYGNNSSTHTNDENNPWWEVDLGQVYDVSKINIWNRTDDCCWNRLQGFYVMISETPITSNSTSASYQYSGSSHSFTSGSQRSITLQGNKRGRYIRVFISGNMKTLSLAEVEVFGQVSKEQSASSSEGVTVYEHTNYGGKSRTFGVGAHDITSTDFNDMISSLKIQKGYKVTLYKDSKFTGQSLVLTVDNKDLIASKFNDITSCLVVEKIATSEAASSSTVLPAKFRVHAFSVHEGKNEKDNYWFALNQGNSRGVILSDSKLVNGAKWLEIERIDLDNNTFAFKITNAGANAYLVARDNKEVHVENVSGGKIPDGAKFKSIAPLTSAKGAENNFRSFESVKYPNHFLRHSGYILFVNTNNNTELFKQDASWQIQKM